MPGSRDEELTLRALKALFFTLHWQERIRPNWLRYPPTERNLELDLYHAPFKLAVEIQGPYRYRSVTGLADAAHSQAQQERDTFKRHRCQELGIKLWTVGLHL